MTQYEDLATPSCQHASRCHCGESHRLRLALENTAETARKASSDAHHWEAVATNAQEELTSAMAKTARMRGLLVTIHDEEWLMGTAIGDRLAALLKDEP